MNRLDTNAQVLTGRISRVAGPTVEARGLRGARMYDRVIIGEMGLQGEVIRLDGDVATCQVYEETTGLSLDEPVIATGEPLLVELGPGLLGSVFDGVQRPLGAVAAVSGDFISRGIAVPALAATGVSRSRRTGGRGNRATGRRAGGGPGGPGARSQNPRSPGSVGPDRLGRRWRVLPDGAGRPARGWAGYHDAPAVAGARAAAGGSEASGAFPS